MRIVSERFVRTEGGCGGREEDDDARRVAE